MKNRIFRKTLGTIFSVVLLLYCSTVYAENIDPTDDGWQYAYGENVGWINFQPSFGPGVTVTDSAVTGYAWGENIGWINLSPADGGVVNDGNGNLSGYAYGENIGWINFAPTGGGVTIEADGTFDGWAWGENIGWIHFQNLTVPYKVQTAWTPAPCAMVNDLSARSKSGKVQLTWTHVGADSYNVYRKVEGGEFSLLANTTSDYSTYLDTDVTNGVTYYYVATSVCDGMESEASNEVGATPQSRIR